MKNSDEDGDDTINQEVHSKDMNEMMMHIEMSHFKQNQWLVEIEYHRMTTALRVG